MGVGFYCDVRLLFGDASGHSKVEPILLEVLFEESEILDGAFVLTG